MGLSDLVGIHYLEGFEKTYKKNPDSYYDEEVETIRVKLDGIIYECYIDPSDGYRSYISGLSISGQPMEFPYDIPQKVEILYVSRDPEDEYSEGWDVIHVINPKTRALILELGTKRYDEWYPHAVCNWYPEAMEINRYR